MSMPPLPTVGLTIKQRIEARQKAGLTMYARARVIAVRFLIVWLCA